MDVEDCGLSQDDVLLTSDQIAARMLELAHEIDERYRGSNLLLVGVLGGGFMIMADLCRALSLPVEIDWLGASSYGSGSRSSGIVQTTKELETNVTGRHVLLVDDILDTGLTISWLTRLMQSGGAQSVASCVLLRKPATSARRIEADFVGFDIPDVFAVGFGLDHAGQYRNLSCVAKADKELVRQSD
ncbi:MAG TPA: hypoxanthine phosphoribosyltransferase [Jatrophihabitans sp.]|nr:hypoxanthine phosphoribosyltransferase [Jatrophihabitans sp.]